MVTKQMVDQSFWNRLISLGLATVPKISSVVHLPFLVNLNSVVFQVFMVAQLIHDLNSLLTQEKLAMVD